MKLLIKNGTVIDPVNGINAKMDILVSGGVIVKTEKNISDRDAKIIDAEGKYVMPGFIDLHVHLREPGYEYKETIETGTRAAAKGGFTKVVCMPNTQPPIDNQAMVEFINMKAGKEGCVDVLVAGTVTKGRAGAELAPIGELVKAGAVAVSDDGSSVMNTELLRRALEYCKMFDIPLMEHCEDTALTAESEMNEGYYSTVLGLKGEPCCAEEVIAARDIMIAKEMDARIHIQHISTKGAVELVRWAKKQGVKVTAEAAPHHFSLDDSMLSGYDTNFKMKPPLRTKEDVKAVKKGLKDGTIDVIATDHAPHAELDKNVEFRLAAPGIIGLETAFPLAVENLVKPGILTISELAERMCVKPAEILGIKAGSLSEGVDADIVIADTEAEVHITGDFFESKSSNSPFIGSRLHGRVETVIRKGKVIIENRPEDGAEERKGTV